MKNSTKALSQAIQKRMAETGLSTQEWARRAGVSDAKLAEMRDGKRDEWTARLERGAERGLGWAPFSFDAIRIGNQPTLIPDDHQQLAVVKDLDARVSALPDEDREWILGAIDRAERASRAKG